MMKKNNDEIRNQNNNNIFINFEKTEEKIIIKMKEIKK